MCIRLVFTCMYRAKLPVTPGAQWDAGVLQPPLPEPTRRRSHRRREGRCGGARCLCGVTGVGLHLLIFLSAVF